MHGGSGAGVVSASPILSPQLRRILACFLLLLAEAFCLSFFFDALPLSLSSSLLSWLGYSGYVLKVALVFTVAIVLALGPKLMVLLHHTGYASAFRWPWDLLRIALHLVFFIAVFLISAALFTEAGGDDLLGALWLTGVAATVVSWAFLVAPLRFWMLLVRQHAVALSLAAVAALLALGVAIGAQNLWGPLATATFSACSLLLSQIYPEILVDQAQFLLGAGEFVVRIGEQCSGYEGIGLIVIFTALYLSLYRDEFRFPRALWLFPLGIIAIWCFNVIRIVLLIVIGQEISPQIAIGGFHSQAGWVMFILVAVAMLLLAERSPLFSAIARPEPAAGTAAGAVPADGRLTPPVAMLIPIIALFGSILLTGLFTVTVDWLYPLRVLIVGVALLWVWPALRLSVPASWVASAGAGIAVFALWLWLVPRDVTLDQEMSAAFELAGSGWLILWFVFRALGAILTVPIAEELAFRGYLLARFSGGEVASNSRLPFSLLALAGSSIAFGLLHDAWLAGILAGGVYGLVRLKAGNLSDAIVAHAVTNALLTGYVLYASAWSLW